MEILKKLLIIFSKIKSGAMAAIRKLINWLSIFVKSEYPKYLLSGLIPTGILLFFVWQQLKQTTEQISYLREPVVELNEKLDLQNLAKHKLYMANFGRETGVNVYINFSLFLVTEKEIYTFERYSAKKPYFYPNDKMGPREKMFPWLSLKPNDEKDMTPYFGFDKFIRDDQQPDLDTILRLMKGKYILFAEYSYRRKSDLILRTDTTYFLFRPYLGPYGKLNEIIGGQRIIDRLRDYLQNGPELSIYIMRDKYEVRKHGLRDEEVNTIMSFPLEGIKQLPKK